MPLAPEIPDTVISNTVSETDATDATVPNDATKSVASMFSMYSEKLTRKVTELELVSDCAGSCLAMAVTDGARPSDITIL